MERRDREIYTQGLYWFTQTIELHTRNPIDRDGKAGRAVRVGPRPAGKKRGVGWPFQPANLH